MPGHQQLQEGDRVTFRVGHTVFHARVVEDRGPLGVGGRQLVRVEVLEDEDTDEAPRRFEMPAEELQRERAAG